MRVRHHLGDGQVGGFAGWSFEIGKLRNIFGDRVRNVEFAVVLAHHHGDRRDEFGHRGHPEKGVGPHRFVLGDVRQPRRFKVEDLVLGDHHGDNARQVVGVNGLLHGRADSGEIGLRKNGGDTEEKKTPGIQRS